MLKIPYSHTTQGVFEAVSYFGFCLTRYGESRATRFCSKKDKRSMKLKGVAGIRARSRRHHRLCTINGCCKPMIALMEIGFGRRQSMIATGLVIFFDGGAPLQRSNFFVGREADRGDFENVDVMDDVIGI